MARIGKKQLIKKIAVDIFGNDDSYALRESERFLDSLHDIICEELIENRNIVSLSGIMKMEVVESEERMGRNPQTGEIEKRPPTRKLKITPTRVMKENVKRGYIIEGYG